MNKLFPPTPSGSFKDLIIDDETMTYITTPQNSNTITAIIESHISNSIDLNMITIFDGTACVGGDTISFGKIFGAVVAVEVKKYIYDMLVNNLNQYELYNVMPINDDCLKILKRLNFIDVAYFDPPWGGKCYKNQDYLRLSISGRYIDEIINDIFELKMDNIKLIVFKLPKNYNIKDLYDKTKHNPAEFKLYTLQKMMVLVIQCKHIK
jgi:16S rRNA G966 N2-methylase RsmD